MCQGEQGKSCAGPHLSKQEGETSRAEFGWHWQHLRASHSSFVLKTPQYLVLTPQSAKYTNMLLL